MPSLSGEQHHLTFGRQRAVVTEVGATLRSYQVDGVPICWGFDEDELSGGGRGQVLAPWPNRLEDGVYEFEGAGGRAALDEPGLANAIHGLVRWLPFRLHSNLGGAVRLETILRPQPAYPFDVRIQVEYVLVDHGLEVRTEATNVGWRRAPFGLGFHDYFDAGPAGADGLRLDLRAGRRLVLDDRRLPVGDEPVAGSAFEVVSPVDHRPRPLGALRLDDCFTALERDPSGRWHAEVVRGDGPLDTVIVWADPGFGYLMAFTGDTLEPEHRRRAVALEPMTCPPNALRTGTNLIVLEPGASFSARWGIELPGLRG